MALTMKNIRKTSDSSITRNPGLVNLATDDEIILNIRTPELDSARHPIL